MKAIIAYIRVDEGAIRNWTKDPAALERCLDRELAEGKRLVLAEIERTLNEPEREHEMIAMRVELA